MIVAAMWAASVCADARAEVRARHERVLPALSDDWDWHEAPFGRASTPEHNEHRKWLDNLRKQARESAERRPVEQVELILKQAKKEK